jgi:uncharacterized C2H2 Zn-finger protein
MVVYICDKCNKPFHTKSSYTKHINTKTVCIDRNNLKIDANKCIYCLKMFSTKGNIVRHIKSDCYVVKKINSEKQEIFNRLKQEELDRFNHCETILVNKTDTKNKELKEELKELENMRLQNKIDRIKCSIIQNSHNTTNIQNIQTTNIYLIGYGKEDLTKLKQKEIIKVLNKGFMSPVELTETIHFNPKYPEYHNVYISSMKDKYAMVYNGKTWNLVNKVELVDQIYDEKKDFISENFEEFYDSLTSSKRNALKEWFNMDDDDQKIKQIKEDLKLLLYNKRKIVLDSIKY